MARKLFISFLGTGFYRECTYFDCKGVYSPTRFIQQATLEQVDAPAWQGTDAIRIFVTEKAKTQNWNQDITSRLDLQAGKEVPYIGLEKVLEEMQLKAEVKAVTDVPIGNGENEMWTIFNMVYNEIQNGDELYIDLTHAFRYLPMLVLVLTGYAKFLKHVTVKHLSYGNWEARDSENHAPIIDLMPIATLQDWTSAASEYLNHGYAGSMKTLTENYLEPRFHNPEETTEEKRAAANIKKFTARIETYATERITCRGKDIATGKSTVNLLQSIESIEEQLRQDISLAALYPIFDAIKKKILANGDILSNCLEAARWCFSKQLYQQAITLLQEGVVSHFCVRHGIPVNDGDQRKLVNMAFSIKKDNTSENQWNCDEKSKELIRKILTDELLENRQLLDSFSHLTFLRNDYNHANFKKDKVESKTLITGIDSAINDFAQLLNQQEIK